MSNEKINPGLFGNIKQDLPASIVVLFVAIPLCLGIALASGASLFSGLIAGIVGGIVVGSLSNSSLGVSGPAAGLAVIVLNSIQSLGAFEIFLVAVVIAGAIQMIMGFLKGGVIAYYFPSAVIKGMLAGIGIIIFLKQIPHAFGYDADYEGDLSFWQKDGENTFTEIIKMVDYISPGALIVSVASLLILLTWDNILAKKHKVFQLIQGPIVAVMFGVFYHIVSASYFPAYAINAGHLVSVPVADSLSGFASLFAFPDFSHALSGDVWVVALTIAIVASLETLLSVEATDKLDPLKRTTDTNRELMAQGTGNMISGLLGGLPITQVIVRSSANIQSGGRTKLSAIMHGIFLLLCVFSIPFVLNMIPLAVLASVLFVVGYKLAKPSLFKQMYKLGMSQFLPFVVTILGIVFTDLLKGIGIGLVVGIVMILRNSLKNSHFLNKETVGSGLNKVKMTLAEEVTFLNKGAILKELNNLPKETELTIDMSKSTHIDYDVLEIIDNYKSTAESKGVSVELINRGDSETADY
ncbi:MAG: SulP family inorganic anion transporter [Cyclobacteriaceae bacterium]|nr:SulP family inorganic anion transporter [Cyclobacteriaceae bacterium]